MPSNHDLAAESAMRRLHELSIEQPSSEFVAKLATSLDLQRKELSTRTMPLRPERVATPLRNQPQLLLAYLAVALLIVSSITWIGVSNRNSGTSGAVGSAQREPSSQELWSLPRPPAQWSVSGVVSVSNGIFYRAQYTMNSPIGLPAGTELSILSSTGAAYDGNTGAEIWSRDMPPASIAASDENGLYLGYVDEQQVSSIALLDARSGEERWRTGIPATARQLRVVGDRIIILDQANNVTTLNRSDGTLLWQMAIGPRTSEPVRALALLFVADSFVVAKAPGEDLQLLSLETGATLWSRDVGNIRQAAISNNTLAVVTSRSISDEESFDSGQIVAYSLTDGSSLWHRDYEYRQRSPQQELFGTSSGFAVLAKSLGPVTSDQSANITPTSASNSAGLASTDEALGKIPSGLVLFGVDPASGATTWVSEWGVPTNDAQNFDGAGIAFVEENASDGSYFVIRYDLTAGWLIPATSPDTLPIIRLTGPADEPIRVPSVPTSAILDGANAYLLYSGGGIVAFTRGSS